MVIQCGENRSEARLSLGLFVLTTILVWIATGCQPPTPTPAPIAPVQPPVISEPKVGAPTPLKPREEVGISVDVSSATGVDLTYTWKADGGEIRRGQESPAITYRAPDEPGTYNVRVIVEWDGQSVEKATSIKVEEEPTPEPTEEPTSEPTEEPMPEPTEEPTSEPTEEPIPDAVVIAPVNLRSGPGTEYDPPVATLSPNQVLTVTGRSDNATSWLQVNTDQMQEGWVVNRADLVTLNLPTEQIPIVPTLPLPTPPPACQITEPADGDENLGYANEVRVTCSDVPDSLHIWILVYSHHDSSYYPQPRPLGSGSGQYEGMAYLGTETEGAGNRFYIIVALADEAANTKLQSDAANHIGWPDLPDGVEEEARITVRRGPSIPRCWITQPAGEDENLGHANEVRVTCSDVPDSLYVWILVYSHHDFHYYPQVGPIGTDSGDYVGIAYLGTEIEGVGHRFGILVALTDEAGNTRLQSDAASFVGWPDLPGGVEEMTRITVTRRH